MGEYAASIGSSAAIGPAFAAEAFSLTPDPGRLFLSQAHAEALAALRRGLEGRRGFIVLVAEVGLGKTTLAYSLLSALGPRLRTAYVGHPNLAFEGLLRLALRDFGVETGARDRGGLLDAVHALCRRCRADGQIPVLVVDEAHGVDDDTFEQLLSVPDLQIVLVGQPELDARLSRDRLRAVADRITIRVRIEPLDADESRRYIAHRLEKAGGSLAMFSAPALDRILHHARGVPRRMNILCHNALLAAYAAGEAHVSRASVARAIEDLSGASLVLLKSRPLTDDEDPRLRWRARLRPMASGAVAAAAGAAAVALALQWWPAREPARVAATRTVAGDAGPTTVALGSKRARRDAAGEAPPAAPAARPVRVEAPRPAEPAAPTVSVPIVRMDAAPEPEPAPAAGPPAPDAAVVVPPAPDDAAVVPLTPDAAAVVATAAPPNAQPAAAVAAAPAAAQPERIEPPAAPTPAAIVPPAPQLAATRPMPPPDAPPVTVSPAISEPPPVVAEAVPIPPATLPPPVRNEPAEPPVRVASLAPALPPRPPAARAVPPPGEVSDAEVRALLDRYVHAWGAGDVAELRRIGQVGNDRQADALAEYFEETGELEVRVEILELGAHGARRTVRFKRHDRFRDPRGREVAQESPPIEKTIVRTPEGLRFAPRS